jgi:hypothetical protein
MPPLLHLATVQSKTNDTNVNHSNIDVDNSGFIDNFVEGNPDTEVVDHIFQAQGIVVIELCPFKHGALKLPLDIAFQIHLLFQLQTHHGNDLNIFNHAMKCIKKRAAYHCVNFSTLEILSRRQLLKELSKHYNSKYTQPTLHCVSLADGSVATVPIFNIKCLLLAFLMIQYV